MSDRTLELVLKAARLLPADEQDELLLALISGTALRRDGEVDAAATEPGIGSAPGPWGSPADAVTAADPLTVHRWRLDRTVRTQPIGTRDALGPAGPGTDDPALKVLPVRLPAADYERLRAFSRQHGFSMAVIIRTLVERFLDGQARRWAGDDEELEETTAGHA